MSWRPRARWLALLVPLLAGCRDAGRACTLIGCYDGLSVTVPSAAAVPFRVEAYVASGGARYAQTCNAAPCVAFFPAFLPQTVTIAVITGTDTASRRFAPVYTVTRPNGPGCDPECRSGSVTFTP